MASMNRVFLAGNLTRDPEVRHIPSGIAVADLGLAINESYKSKSGEMVENTIFVDVVVWGRQAETSGEYLSKGSPVLIEGRLQLDAWETKEGDKRSKLRVRADRVQFLSSPRKADYSGAPSAGGDSAPKSSNVGSAPAPTEDDDDLPF